MKTIGSLALPLALSLCAVLAACDEKKDSGATAPSASAAASAAPIASVTATTTAIAASAEPSAAPSASAAERTSTKDPTLSVLDPKTESSKTLKAQAGGTATLYLPQWAGTTWTAKETPKPLGKAKTETLPGFAGPGTPGVSFVWTLKDPSLKPGQSMKVVLENKSSADKTAAPTTFTLTIEIVAG